MMQLTNSSAKAEVEYPVEDGGLRLLDSTTHKGEHIVLTKSSQRTRRMQHDCSC